MVKYHTFAAHVPVTCKNGKKRATDVYFISAGPINEDRLTGVFIGMGDEFKEELSKLIAQPLYEIEDAEVAEESVARGAEIMATRLSGLLAADTRFVIATPLYPTVDEPIGDHTNEGMVAASMSCFRKVNGKEQGIMQLIALETRDDATADSLRAKWSQIGRVSEQVMKTALKDGDVKVLQAFNYISAMTHQTNNEYRFISIQADLTTRIPLKCKRPSQTM